MYPRTTAEVADLISMLLYEDAAYITGEAVRFHAVLGRTRIIEQFHRLAVPGHRLYGHRVPHENWRYGPLGLQSSQQIPRITSE